MTDQYFYCVSSMYSKQLKESKYTMSDCSKIADYFDENNVWNVFGDGGFDIERCEAGSEALKHSMGCLVPNTVDSSSLVDYRNTCDNLEEHGNNFAAMAIGGGGVETGLYELFPGRGDNATQATHATTAMDDSGSTRTSRTIVCYNSDYTRVAVMTVVRQTFLAALYDYSLTVLNLVDRSAAVVYSVTSVGLNPSTDGYWPQIVVPPGTDTLIFAIPVTNNTKATFQSMMMTTGSLIAYTNPIISFCESRTVIASQDLSTWVGSESSNGYYSINGAAIQSLIKTPLFLSDTGQFVISYTFSETSTSYYTIYDLDTGSPVPIRTWITGGNYVFGDSWVQAVNSSIIVLDDLGTSPSYNTMPFSGVGTIKAIWRSNISVSTYGVITYTSAGTGSYHYYQTTDTGINWNDPIELPTNYWFGTISSTTSVPQENQFQIYNWNPIDSDGIFPGMFRTRSNNTQVHFQHVDIDSSTLSSALNSELNAGFLPRILNNGNVVVGTDPGAWRYTSNTSDQSQTDAVAYSLSVASGQIGLYVPNAVNPYVTNVNGTYLLHFNESANTWHIFANAWNSRRYVEYLTRTEANITNAVDVYEVLYGKLVTISTDRRVACSSNENALIDLYGADVATTQPVLYGSLLNDGICMSARCAALRSPPGENNLVGVYTNTGCTANSITICQTVVDLSGGGAIDIGGSVTINQACGSNVSCMTDPGICALGEVCSNGICRTVCNPDCVCDSTTGLCAISEQESNGDGDGSLSTTTIIIIVVSVAAALILALGLGLGLGLKKKLVTKPALTKLR